MALQLPAVPNYGAEIAASNVSPLDEYGKMLQLKNLLGQQQLLPLQLQEAQQNVQQEQLKTQQMQLEQQSQQALVKAWSDPDFAKSFTGTDAADQTGMGFDPQAMTKALVAKGVLPKDAMAITSSFLDRSKNIAEIVKTNAQAGEAQQNIRDKTLTSVADKIGSIQELKTPEAQAAALDQFHQDLVKNPKAYQGLTNQEMQELSQTDVSHLDAVSGLIGFEKKLNDFHEARFNEQKAQQSVIDPKTGLSPDAQQYITKDVKTAQLEQPLKIQQAAAEAEARQKAMQGDPNAAGQLLANGSLTLADLKTRGSTAKFIEQATAAAQQIDPKYNPADEMIAEHVAKSSTANQFFGSANSLIGKGGTLDQLAELGKNIPQHDFPVLNTVDDWQKLARGKGPLAGYAATALGVADDYGKVMGGGNASDHARDAALKLFSQASSPEQRAQAIQSTRNAVLSQRDQRIGTNKFLKREYGSGELGGQSVIYARDPQGVLHQAPAGTALPQGWKQENR